MFSDKLRQSSHFTKWRLVTRLLVLPLLQGSLYVREYLNEVR